MNNSAQGPRLIPRKLKPFLNATNHIALRIKIYCKPIRRCYTFGNQPIMVIDFSQSVAAKLSFWPWKLPQNLDRRANKKKRATTPSHTTHTQDTQHPYLPLHNAHSTQTPAVLISTPSNITMRFSTLVACASAALVAAPLTAFAQDLGTTCGKNTCQVAEQCCTDTNICIQPADLYVCPAGYPAC